MSADATGAIGPVSVRYAAQIRELLFAQAMQRMAAEQEAARASAQAERAEAAAPPVKEAEPIEAKVKTPEPAPLPEPIKAPEAKTDAPVQLVDILA
jgi:hypothetical protein